MNFIRKNLRWFYPLYVLLLIPSLPLELIEWAGWRSSNGGGTPLCRELKYLFVTRWVYLREHFDNKL